MKPKASKIEKNEARVALDGGTTTTRARLFVGSQLVATAVRPVGIRDAVLDDRPARLAEAARSAVAEVCRLAEVGQAATIVASGMLTSELGLAVVPHVAAPAGIEELAAGAATLDRSDLFGGPVLLVPGVRTPPAPGPLGWSEADVMRGEECETLGAALELGGLEAEGSDVDPRRVFVWPGSHTKVVELDGAGRITGSRTTLAGEMIAALGRQTILAASLPVEWPETLDPGAYAAGAELATREGLGRAAFLVRVAALAEVFPAEHRAAFLIGAVIAEDLDRLAPLPSLAGATGIWVGGRRPQRDLYAQSLAERLSVPVAALTDAVADRAAAVGALAVARRFTELRSS